MLKRQLQCVYSGQIIACHEKNNILCENLNLYLYVFGFFLRLCKVYLISEKLLWKFCPLKNSDYTTKGHVLSTNQLIRYYPNKKFMYQLMTMKTRCLSSKVVVLDRFH